MANSNLTAAEAQQIEPSLKSGDYRKDPYKIYATLRQKAPVYFSEAWNGWIVSRYGDVEQVLRQVDRFSNEGRLSKLIEPLPEEARQHAEPIVSNFNAGIQHSDPPAHTLARNLCNRAFTPGIVNAMEGRIQELVDELIDPVMKEGEIDLVADFALKLPASVLGHILGFSLQECERFRKWDDDHVALVSSRTARPDLAERANQSAKEQVAWLGEVTAKRRAHPGDDVFSTLVAGLDNGELRDMRDLQGTYLAILVGGHETTTGLISSAIRLLLERPEQMEQLLEEPEMMPRAVEEFLRYESPIQFVPRIAAKDTEMRGTEIAQGDLVMPMIGSANRDPDAFQDPEELDIEREPNRHLAFGYGIHFCLGALLARLEGRIALNTLLQRFRHVRLTDNRLEWQETDVFRVLKNLPIAFDAA